MDRNIEQQYGQVLIYNTSDENTKLEVKFYEDTVWLSQEQLANLILVNIYLKKLNLLLIYLANLYNLILCYLFLKF